MADNLEANAASGGATFAADDIGGVYYVRQKIVHGADGTNDGDVSTANPLPVRLYVGTTAMNLGGGVESGALRVTLASDSTGVVSVDDNGSSLTVDGTVAATQSGTWNVTNISGTVSLPTGASTSANQTTIIGHLDGVEGLLTTIDADTGGILTAVQLIDDAIYTDDVPFTAGSNKVMAAGFRYDDTTPDAVQQGDVGYARMSSRRELYATIRDAAGNERGMNVDASGAITVNVAAGTNNIGDVDVLSVVPGTAATSLGKAVDAAAGGTDTGVAILAVRDDSLSALTPAEGDYTHLRVSSTGALHVTGGGGGTQYNVDDVAGATDTGTLLLAIRDDSLATLTPADGDYVGLRVSSTGALHVTGGGGGTEYNEDAATPATITGTATMMERDDALSALTPIEGDWAAMRCSANGALWVAVDGTVAATQSGTWNITNVSGTVSLPTGASTSANQTTIIGHLDGVEGLLTTIDADTGSILTAVQLIDDTIFADDAAFTLTSSKVGMAGAIRDNALAAALSAAEGDAVPLRVTQEGGLWVTPTGSASGGLSTFRSIDLDESEEEVKASAGTVYTITAFNATATILYLKLYNATAANVTVGTTTPTQTFVIPANSSTGAGFVINIDKGIAFDTAISAAVTTGVADSDTGAPAANAAIVQIFYK